MYINTDIIIQTHTNAKIHMQNLREPGRDYSLNHRVIESSRLEKTLNHQGWKRPTGSSSPTVHQLPIVLTKPCPSTQQINVP